MSVCTSVVRLAGALGQVVWVLAPHCPYWPYRSSGDDMAWYPRVRVFRQHRAGASGPALKRAGTALDGHLTGRSMS